MATTTQPHMAAPIGKSPVLQPPSENISQMLENARIFQPVDQNGSFQMDRVIKDGWLLKRNRRTKAWKKRWVVLRGDRLSFYKDQTEYKIHRQILLSELNAVAKLRDAKRPYVFGLFSAARNFYFQGESEADAQDWVDLIRNAAVVDGDNELSLSDVIRKGLMAPNVDTTEIPDRGGWCSSPEPSNHAGARKISALASGTLSSQTLEYSGIDIGSCSSMSEGFGGRYSQLSLAAIDPPTSSGTNAPIKEELPAPEPGVQRNGSGFSADDDSRLIYHGYLYCLKSKGGMKKWKKYWIVLRSKNLAFYKDDNEYRAIRLVPLDTIVDAVEIDALSKSKKFCLQIITEEKTYRFAAGTEESLARWLGALKCTLVKRRPIVENEEQNNKVSAM